MAGGTTVIDEQIRKFQSADRTLQERGNEPKLWNCDYTDYEKERKKLDDKLHRDLSTQAGEEAKGTAEKLKALREKIRTMRFDGNGMDIRNENFDRLGDPKAVAEGLMSANSGEFGTMRVVRAYSQGARGRFESLAGSLKTLAEDPPNFATGAANFDCNADLPKMSGALRKRAADLTRVSSDRYLAGLIKGADRGGDTIDYYQKQFEKTYVNGNNEFINVGGTCGGLSDTVKAIARSIQEQRRAVETLVKYSQDKAKSLTELADRVDAVKKNCGSR